MKAIIMAGGSGTRLRPLTCKQPKPLIRLLDKPTMAYSLDLLAQHGFGEVGITTCYLANQISSCFGENYQSMRLDYFEESTPLQTAGAVYHAGDYPKHPLLIISGDALCDIDLGAAIANHQKSGCTATIVLKRVPIPLEYGVVLLTHQNIISGFVEKPDWTQVYGDLVNTGIYILDPSVWEGYEVGQSFDFAKDVFANMMQAGTPINGYVTDGYWCDIGNVDQYLQAQKALLKGVCKAQINAVNYNGMYIQDGAKVDSTALLRAPCFIGSGATIGKHCSIEAYSVIDSGATLQAFCSVKQSVIGRNASLGAKVQVRGAIICDHAVIQDGAGIFEGSVIADSAKVLSNSVIHKRARIWPEKVAQGNVDSNVVWGKADLTQEGSKLLLSDPTPELYCRVGKAIGLSTKDAVICVASDGDALSAVFKQALLAGLLYAGAHVYDLKCCLLPVLSDAVPLYQATNGVFVRAGEVQIFNEKGTHAPGGLMRSVQSALEQGAQGNSEPGVLRAQVDPLPLYCAKVSAPYQSALQGQCVVFLDEPQSETSGKVLKLLCSMCGCETIFVQTPEQIKRTLRSNSAAAGMLGVGIQEDKLTLYTAQGELESGVSAMVFALLELENGAKELITDSYFPDGFAQFAKKYDVAITCLHSQSLPLRDPFWQTLALLRYLSKEQTTLDALVEKLPKVRQTSRSIKVAFSDISRILRNVSEENAQERIERTEGLKLFKDGAWIHIVPKDASIRITASTFNEEYSQELADVYASKIKKMTENKNPTQ